MDQTNLFKINIDTEQTKRLNALKQNIAFADKLVRDLVETFDVVVSRERRDQDTHRIVVYQPQQANRYGYGFTFEATSEGVEFKDGRGLWLISMAKVLNVTVTDSYDKRVEDVEILKKAADKIGVVVVLAPNSGCGDHYYLKMKLNEKDAHLNEKIKAIIGTMQGQNVVTRL